MACTCTIEAYGSDAEALPTILEEAFDEVDRIDRLMSHYRATSSLSRVNREARATPGPGGGRGVVRFHRRRAAGPPATAGGEFDITVGPLMKAWGFFGGEGRVPGDEEVEAARLVGARPCGF